MEEELANQCLFIIYHKFQDILSKVQRDGRKKPKISKKQIISGKLECAIQKKKSLRGCSLLKVVTKVRKYCYWIAVTAT